MRAITSILSFFLLAGTCFGTTNFAKYIHNGPVHFRTNTFFSGIADFTNRPEVGGVQVALTNDVLAVDVGPTTNLMNALSLNRPHLEFPSGGTNGVITVEGGASPLTYYFDGGTVDYATPTNVYLTAGADGNTTIRNYICANPDGSITTVTAFPTGERAILFSVVMLGTNALTVQRYTEQVGGPDERSRISHIGERVRRDGAKWESGTAVTVVTNASTDLHIEVASGNVWQLHRQTWSAITNRTTMYVMNDTNGVTSITNLFQIDHDADGDATLDSNQRRFNVEVLGYQASGMSNNLNQIMLLLSTGDYGSDAEALADSDSLAVTSIDQAFIGGSFRIAQLTLRVNAGVMTAIVTDRRGQPLGLAGGGSAGGASSSVFSDSSFRVHDDLVTDADISFQVSNVTASTTREYQAPDVSGWLAVVTNQGAGAQGEVLHFGATTGSAHWDALVSAAGGGMLEDAQGNIIPTNATSVALNTATNAVVSGGVSNKIGGLGTTVGGGFGNVAKGVYSTIAGGRNNRFDADYNFIGGGDTNRIDGAADYCVVGGGVNNLGGGSYSSMLGGSGGICDGAGSFLGGGLQNRSRGQWSVCAGGYQNSASGQTSMCPGGESCDATQLNSWAAGDTAQAIHVGAFVWSDTTVSHSSSASNQFVIGASGGLVLFPGPSPVVAETNTVKVWVEVVGANIVLRGMSHNGGTGSTNTLLSLPQ